MPLALAELMYDAHAIEELSGLNLGAAQLEHAVRDGHDLAEHNVVDASHSLDSELPVHVVPRSVVRDGLKLQVRGFVFG